MSKSVVMMLVLVFLTGIIIIVANPVSAPSASENAWSTKGPIPQETGGRAAVVNGKIYVMGGSYNYEYDPETDNWAAKTPMPSARQYFGIAVYQNKIYTIGGGLWDSDIGWITSNLTEVFDPATDSWENKTGMPTSRMSLYANEVDEKIYLLGGRTGGPSSIVALNEVYDVANDSWTTRKPMRYPVDAYASAVVDDKIYVMGGFEGLYHGVPVGFNQIYDPVMDKWSLGAPLPHIVRNAAAGATTGTLAPKRIYVIGGGSDMVATNLTQVYDPENNSWTMGAQMSTARGWLAVAVVNDLLYAIGGSPYLTSPFMGTNEQYMPFGYETPELSPTPSPESFPTTLVVASVITIVAVGLGLAFYFKKRKR